MFAAWLTPCGDKRKGISFRRRWASFSQGSACSKELWAEPSSGPQQRISDARRRRGGGGGHLTKSSHAPHEDPSPQMGGTDAQMLPWDNSLGAVERRKAILPVRTQNLGKQGARLPLARW